MRKIYEKIICLRDKLPSKYSILITVFAILGYWLFALNYNLTNTPKIPETVFGLLRYVVFRGTLFISVIYFLLWFSRNNWQSIGFVNKKIIRQILNGVLFGSIIFLFTTFVLPPILKLFIKPEITSAASIGHLFTNPKELPIWIFIGIFGGGLLEEIERIFTIVMFKKLMGKTGLYLSLFLTTFTFGIFHLYQGKIQAVSAGISGLLYAVVYLRKGKILEAVAAHSIYDIIGITLAYILIGKA